MRLISKAAFVIACLITNAALARTIENLPKGDQLDLTTETPEHIVGVFRRDNVLVRFDGTRTAHAASLVLSEDRTGVIYKATAEGLTYKIEFYGGGFTIRGRFAESSKETMPAPETTGDKILAERFAHSAEYKALPFLSRDLGAAGITGVMFPASLYIHGLALASAHVNKIEAPDIEAEGKKAVERKPPCPDPAADPTKCKNDCFGMCGPGCDCWKRVCGDCCMHAGCLTHDTTMRLCDCGVLSHFSDCLKSWTALSYISTGGEGPPCMLVKGCKNPPKCD